jgi:hypothetical protein
MKSFNFKNLYIFNLIELNISKEYVIKIYNLLNLNNDLPSILNTISKEDAKVIKEKMNILSNEAGTYSVFALSFETNKKIMIFNSIKNLESLVDNYYNLKIRNIINDDELVELIEFLTDFLDFKYGIISRSIKFFENSVNPELAINLLHHLNKIRVIDLNITKNICNRLLNQKVIKKMPEGLIINTKLDEFHGKDYINDTLKGTNFYLLKSKKNNFKIDSATYEKYRILFSKNNTNFQVSDFKISLLFSNINDAVKIYRYIKIEENINYSFNFSEQDENISIEIKAKNEKTSYINEKIAERKALVYRYLHQVLKPYLLANDKYVIDLKLILELISVFSTDKIPYLDIQDIYYALSTSSDFIKLSNCFVFDKNYKVSFNLYNFIYNKLSETKFHINIEEMYNEYNEKILFPKISLGHFIDLIIEKYLGNFFKKFILIEDLLLFNLNVDNEAFLTRTKSQYNIKSLNRMISHIRREYKLSNEQIQYIFDKVNISKVMNTEQEANFGFQIIHERNLKEFLNEIAEKQQVDYFLSNLKLEKKIYYPNTYFNLDIAIKAFVNSFKSPQSIKSLSRFISREDLLKILKPYFKSNDLFLFEKDTLLTGDWNNLSTIVSSFLQDLKDTLKNESFFTIFSCRNNKTINKILLENQIISTLGNEFIENLLIYNADIFSNTINNYRVYSFKDKPRLSNMIKSFIYKKRKTYFSEISGFLETFYGIRYNVTKKDLKEMPFFYISPETENVFSSLEYYRKVIKEQLEND